MNYDAVLFDNDGVLVEPPGRESQAAATRAAFAAVGVEDPAAEHVHAVVDGVTVEGLRELCGAYGIDPERFWTARERRDEQAQVRDLRAGERELYDDVSAVETLPRPRGVVSNNHDTTVAFVVEFFDLGGLFDAVHGRPKTVASLDRKKPAPDYVEAGLADVGAESALYVGDSASDVLAAHRAGIDSAFLRRSHVADADLPVEPTHEVADLHGVAALVG